MVGELPKISNKKIGNIFKGDKVIWMVFFFLCMISIVEVFSASSTLTYKGGSYMTPVLKHIGMLCMGLFCCVVTLNIECKYFKLLTPFLIIVSVFTLIIVLFGPRTNDGARWISILGFQFQPSEIAKGTLVLAEAQILSAMQTDNGAAPKAYRYIVGLSAFVLGLIVLENFSTAALLGLVVLMMMFVGRVPMAQLGKLLGGIALAAVVLLILILAVGRSGNDAQVDGSKTQLTEQVDKGEGENAKEKSGLGRIFHRVDTWKARIMKFTSSKDVPPDQVDLDKDGQTAHANIAIATSNIIGKGPGNSTERDFLSQAFSDFIYAIIIEELGIEGGIFVVMLYLVLLIRVARIATRCENNFPAFLAMGLALLLVTQAMFNMMVAVGLAPVTGQPLPLISKGGTSTVINCIYIGAILSVSRSAKKVGQRSSRNRNKVHVAEVSAGDNGQKEVV